MASFTGFHARARTDSRETAKARGVSCTPGSGCTQRSTPRPSFGSPSRSSVRLCVFVGRFSSSGSTLNVALANIDEALANPPDANGFPSTTVHPTAVLNSASEHRPASSVVARWVLEHEQAVDGSLLLVLG